MSRSESRSSWEREFEKKSKKPKDSKSASCGLCFRVELESGGNVMTWKDDGCQERGKGGGRGDEGCRGGEGWIILHFLKLIVQLRQSLTARTHK